MPPDGSAARDVAAPVTGRAVTARAITVAILAMGGEGGGVLADWLVSVAEHAGYVAQTTSVPGVAQRTGATIYYVEMFPGGAAAEAGREPVLALMPVPGDVDVVVASELMEAGRAIQRGLVTPERTTFVLSTHRVFAMTEKIVPGDGRADAAGLLEACRKASKRLVAADMQALADANGSVISATLFGGLAGAAALPFARGEYEDAIRRAGVGVNSSLAAFAAGYEAAQSVPALAPVTPEVLDIIAEGRRRLVDYQDAAYAAQYEARLAPIRAMDTAHGDGRFTLLDETARHLALWMSYEDTVRVADLKIRPSRFARVRTEVRAAPDQLVRIKEFLHPRVQEIAESLPAAWGRWLLGSRLPRRLVEKLASRGRVVETTSISGFLLLWLVAGMRRWRRGSLRFGIEQARIEAWLARIAALAPTQFALAVEVAQCQRLVKGYGDTFERGLHHFARLMDAAQRLEGRPDAAAVLARLRAAALADETGGKLTAGLLEAGVAD
jgi:indolepyruvate ferredoxin oxidoreductase beta subunit